MDDNYELDREVRKFLQDVNAIASPLGRVSIAMVGTAIPRLQNALSSAMDCLGQQYGSYHCMQKLRDIAGLPRQSQQVPYIEQQLETIAALFTLALKEFQESTKGKQVREAYQRMFTDAPEEMLAEGDAEDFANKH